MIAPDDGDFEGDLINHYLNLMHNNGDYDVYDSIKSCFGDNVAIESWDMKYPSFICEPIVTVYMPVLIASMPDVKIPTHCEEKPKTKEESYKILQNILSEKNTKLNKIEYLKTVNKIKKKFPDIFGK